MDPGSASPRREVHCADALPWLAARGVLSGTAAITSLPDVSEVALPLPAWRAWFLDAVRRVVGAVPPSSGAVFFQSDIKRDGAWVDKGALVLRAAEDAGARVLFHKIICRGPPGRLTPGRPGFTHLIAVSREARCPDGLPIPDVITDPGPAPWVRAMGVRAAGHAVRFVRDHLGARTVLDPFCGVGTVLAAANAAGLDAIGVDQSRRRCERARELVLRPDEI
ncbi:MAG: SAM-dependent methyltransferase [Verrucomicrobia bacterium]|nr:SAM-dependent methyltransferase [Verrucomicrobiota bacterium]